MKRHLNFNTRIYLGVLAVCLFLSVNVFSQTPSHQKTTWHGFDRYDFVMDEQTLQLTPIVKTDEEGMGVKVPETGTRRCIVVTPKQAVAGKPWSWRGCYWDHEPWAEIELLKRGYHIAFITTDPDQTWDTWYKYLTTELGLSSKPAFIGMSRGGSNAYTWGTNHPDKVSAICADNPGLSHSSLMKMDLLAANNVPLLNICGSIDPILHNTLNIENIYHSTGGCISVLIKDGPAHHPHSLRDPNIIADFIEQSFKGKIENTHAFIPEKYKTSSLYNTKNNYEFYPSENVWITTRGPFFTGKFSKYVFPLQGVEGSISVFAPQKIAPGMPWVYRCDQINGSSSVDLSLLEKGFHIVVGPVPYNADGPIIEHWNMVYNYLTGSGFSEKPVVAGCGAATGEVYTWAIENPGKIACIYGENPIMRASTAKIQPMDNLKPLADAGIPLIHACGSLDPNLNSQSKEVEKRYQALGGKATIIIDEGRAHYPLSPQNPEEVVSLIQQYTKNK